MATAIWPLENGQKRLTKSAPIVFAHFRPLSLVFARFRTFSLAFALLGRSVSDYFWPCVFALFRTIPLLLPSSGCHLDSPDAYKGSRTLLNRACRTTCNRAVFRFGIALAALTTATKDHKQEHKLGGINRETTKHIEQVMTDSPNHTEDNKGYLNQARVDQAAWQTKTCCNTKLPKTGARQTQYQQQYQSSITIHSEKKGNQRHEQEETQGAQERRASGIREREREIYIYIYIYAAYML